MEAMNRGAADYLIKDEITPALLERSIRYAIAQARHLDELRRQKDELRTSELRFRAVVQSANDGIIITDGEARIILWNSGAEAVFGFTEDEVLGYPLELLMPERYRDAHRIGLERFRMTGRSDMVGRTIEVEGLRKDGTDFPLELSLASWSTAEGTFFTAIVRDITERKRSDEERRAKESAEVANRAKSSFVANVSHELRTPLTAILGFANLLLQGRVGQMDSPAREIVERIHANAKDQLQLINSMLDLSKIEAGQVDVRNAPIDLNSVVQDVVHQFDGRPNRDVAIVASLPARMAPFSTDATKLKQVLMNLVENALKFTDSGTVTVHVETGPFDSVPVRIDVIDTGVGIPPERMDEVFEPFQQVGAVKNVNHAGTGLGLSICRQLCDLLGYSLEVRSSMGAGSTFSVVLEPQADRVQLSA
jgi:protein-histidine pros-kinase